MDRLSARHLMALCLAVLMTAVNGGALALAASAETASQAGLRSVAETAATVGQDVQLDACCQALDVVSEARQNPPTCKVGSSDCGGPLPTVGTLAGGSADLWSFATATAHRDHLGEHQLRPPRL